MELDGECILLDEYSHILPSLIYSPTNIPGRGVNVSDLESQLLGCKCSDNDICANSSACQTVHVCGRNYSSNKLLLEEKWGSVGSASVVECNSLCTCSLVNCSNRVVQFGPRKCLEIFMTGPEKGYGLKTLEFIPKGAFICEYSGEVIGWNEAQLRFSSVSDEGRMNFIFVLREMTDGSNGSSVIKTIVDPSYIGNIGRYINHSCDPNSGIVPVRIDSPVPRLAIFAKRDILPQGEITYDYSGGFEASNIGNTRTFKKIPCYCGAHICQGSLPFDVSLI